MKLKKFEELEHTSDYYASHGNLEINRRKQLVGSCNFEFKDIKMYFQGLIDDGWTVISSNVSYVSSIDRNYNFKPGRAKVATEDSRIVGYKIGVSVQKDKNYDDVRVGLDTHSDITSTSIQTHINCGWNYEEELKDLHELISIVEEIKGRMEDDGFEVFFSKQIYDNSKPYGKEKRIIGIYFDILKSKKM